MSITIYGELYSSKNSKRIVRFGDKMALIPSKAYMGSVKPIEQQLVLNRYKWLKEIENCSKPLKIGFYIYRKTKRAWDWNNINQGISDLLVRCGWLQDDNVYEYIPVFLGWEVDKNNPRVEISVINQ